MKMGPLWIFFLIFTLWLDLSNIICDDGHVICICSGVTYVNVLKW